MGGGRPINLAVVAIYTIVTAGLLWVPLLNVLHAEASTVIAVLAFFLAGIDAIAMFRQGQRARPRVRTVVFMHWAYLVVPFMIYQFARIWLPACGFWVGVKFFVLFPIITVVLAVGIAFLLTGLRVRRPRLWFLIVGLLLVLLPVIYDLAWHPQFYVYNHIFGGILGPIYDLELATRPGLYWFRILTLLWAGMAVLVGYAMREPVRGGIAWIAACAAAIFLLYLNADRLGFNTTYKQLADELGSVWRTSRFVIHYDSSSVSQEEIRHLAADHEFRYHQLSQRLGFEAELPIHSYLYPTASVRARLTGAGYTNIAPVWLGRPQVHVLVETYERSFSHELAHVFSREMGLPIVSASPYVGLVEGFAVAMEPPDGFPPPDDQVAAIINSPSRSGIYGKGTVAQAVAKSLSPAGFWTGRGAVSYTTMGSFVDYLIGHFGVEDFARVYGAEGFKSVFGVSVGSLADDWEQTLVGRTVPVSVHDLASARFSILSLFERHCPHDISPAYRYMRIGSERLAVGDTTGSLVRFERSMQIEPRLIEALDAWSMLKLAQGDYDEVAPKLGSIWQPDEPFPAVLGIRLGDAHALTRNPTRARVAYQAAIETTSPFLRSTRAILKLRLLVADRPEIVEQLVSGRDAKVRAQSLVSMADSTGANLLFGGLLWAEADDYRAAVDALKAATGGRAADAIGERYWSWLTAFAFRAREFAGAERFSDLAVEEAFAEDDQYQVARLEDFKKRISWARDIGLK